MQPERFVLAVDLLRGWGLLDGESQPAAAIELRAPFIADDDLLLLAHDRAYVEFVRSASEAPFGVAGYGIVEGDTPPFSGMHEAAARAVGASVLAARDVLGGRATRAFNPSGGLHHAHRDHASGFCIYNDVVVAIEDAIRRLEGLRIAYVDVDAHHGDGVEAAFAERPDVLTISVHESGRYLFPGTGRATDTGNGAGIGTTIDVPLPPFADARCYAAVHDAIIVPAVTRFAPDVLFVQGGADTHRSDPLTHLALDIPGYVDLVSGLVGLAEATCSGRIVMLGGGGYQPCDEVPRMWASAACVLAGTPIPLELPEEWLECSRACARRLDDHAPEVPSTLSESSPDTTEEQQETAWLTTRSVIQQVREAAPLLRDV